MKFKNEGCWRRRSSRSYLWIIFTIFLADHGKRLTTHSPEIVPYSGFIVLIVFIMNASKQGEGIMYISPLPIMQSAKTLMKCKQLHKARLKWVHLILNELAFLFSNFILLKKRIQRINCEKYIEEGLYKWQTIAII